MMHTGLFADLPPAARLSSALLASRMADRAPQGDAIKPMMEALGVKIAGVLAGLNPAPAQVTLASLGIVTIDFGRRQSETLRLVSARGTLRLRLAAGRDLDSLLCEAAFGGTGQMMHGDPALSEEHPPSHIEQRLRAHVFDAVAEALAQLLRQAGVEDLTCSASRDEARIKGRSPASEAYVARFLVTLFALSAEFEVQAERDVLRDLLGVGADHEDVAPAHAQLGLPGLAPCAVELAARLPRELMDFQRVAALKPGDLLELSARPDAVVEVVSGDRPVFRARLVPRSEGRLQLDIEGAA